jgi:hypothetical protein
MSQPSGMLFGIIRIFPIKKFINRTKPQLKPISKMSLFNGMVHRLVNGPMNLYGIKLSCPGTGLQKNHFPKIRKMN